MRIAHAVTLETQAGGAMILRSAHAMGPVADTTGQWLHRWAEDAPDRVFLAERSGAGWREETYHSVLGQVRAIAGALLGRGLNAATPVMVISGNGVDHGLLALATQYAGIPLAPAAEQYALIPAAHHRLVQAAELIRPKLVYAADGAQYADALALPVFAGAEIVTSRNPGGATPFAALLKGGRNPDAAHAATGPDSVAKILMTSGSTSHPKGVLTTQRMMCVNQTQIAGALPFLRARPPRIVDWLPWNHVFGGSHNFNMMLANGGSLYIDDGKPTAAGFARTLENLSMMTGTAAFNVPLGFSMLLDALQADSALRQRFFAELDLVFYAGASLPQEVWDGIMAMAAEVSGRLPLITTSWGLTETAPACVMQHEQAERSGIIGVPLTGIEAKLVPAGDTRFEIRVRGPSVMPGYFNDPMKTAEAFDEEGYFITGDAVRFLDAAVPQRGLVFDGRISEDFKLLSGTWVRAAALRLEILTTLSGLANDVVLTGAGKAEIGVLVFPLRSAAEGADDHDGALIGPALSRKIAARLAPLSETSRGSAACIARALVLSEPASMADGEMTAKGNLNFNRVLARRAALAARLYDDDEPALIRPGKMP